GGGGTDRGLAAGRLPGPGARLGRWRAGWSPQRIDPQDRRGHHPVPPRLAKILPPERVAGAGAVRDGVRTMSVYEVRRDRLHSFHGRSIALLETELRGHAWPPGYYPVTERDPVDDQPGRHCGFLLKTREGTVRFHPDASGND